MREPAIRLKAKATVRETEALIFVKKYVLLEHSNLAHLIALKVVDSAVGIVKKHLCEHAEEGEAVIPVGVALGTAAVSLKAS